MSPKSPYLRTVSINRPGAAVANPGTTATVAAPVRGPASILGLSPEPQGCEKITVEHAVFTSIRSHTGEGYRLIAATPGIRQDERAEITRRCPSHGSLCDDSANAVGMSFFTLTSERHLIAIHCHAGVEHTARGGQRVYTHLVVLDNAQFAQFGNDAGRVAFAIARAIGDALVLKTPTRFDSLTLAVTAPADAVRADKTTAESARNLAIYLLNNQSRAFTTANDSLQTLSAALNQTPAFIRARAACTVGLKFSPSRPMRFILAPKDGGELARNVRGHEYEFVDLSTATPQVPQTFAPWIDFVDRRIKTGRLNEVAALNDELTTHCPAELLNRFAEMCDAMDCVDRLDAEGLEKARTRFAQPVSQSPAEAKRLMALHVAMDRRATALKKDKPATP